MNPIRSFILPAAAILTMMGACGAPRPPDSASRQTDRTLSASEKRQVIAALARALRDDYAYPALGDTLATMLERHQAHGDYTSISAGQQFADTLTAQMYAISHDGHMHLSYSSRPVPPLPPPGASRGEPSPEQLRAKARDNYEFREVKILPGNVGYLELTGFSHPVELASPTAAAAMAFLANTEALIIDLRDNPGGHPEMVNLFVSYFFSDHPVLLYTMRTRNPGTNQYTDRQVWTLSHVPGKRYVGKPVYVLTSHTTFSGAEEFAYDMKTNARATIVGEVTGGGANLPQTILLTSHFLVGLPSGYPVNPITHANWEGTGVEPDVRVHASEALRHAYRSALDTLIATATDPRQRDALNDALARVEGQPGGARR